MSSRPLIVISTRLPPQLCGIGTFSWLLHQHWPSPASPGSEVRFLVVEGAAESAAALGYDAISEFNAKAAKLSRALESAGGADVFLHYAGRAYHRYGCPLWLPAVLRKWKAKSSAGRLLVFFHELPAEFPARESFRSPIASKHYWIDRCNRRIIRKLARLADAIITNTSDHVAKIEKISGRAGVHVVPVGSNIIAPVPRPPDPPQRVPTEFVVFGLPFGRWQTLQMFDSEIRAWQSSGRLTRLHLVGPPDEKFDLRSEKLIATWPDSRVVTRHGMLPSSEVSKLLARAQFGLSNVALENWSKSTAFMAYASHGCAIVGRLPGDHAPPPLCFTISPNEVATISDVDLDRRTQSLKEWYDHNADWNIIARKISSLLPAGGDTATDEIVIIAPESTPGAGGVGDYTLKLIHHWPRKQTRVLVPGESDSHGTNAILKQLPATSGKVLVQYSAYGFNRTGYPRSLIRALIDWKTKTHGRLVVMFHEIWTFWPILNKNFIMQFLHRRAIKRLLGCADVIFTSTSSQVEHLRALNPSAQVCFLPVGSNIECHKDIDLPRKPGWAVVFGLQRARIRTLKKMQRSLSELADAGRITKIVTIGANGDGNAEERGLLAGLGLQENFEQLGPQSEREISELLLTASFGISAQDELSYSKSGTFMACAAHGLNIIAECADRSKPEPLCLLINPRQLLAGISEAELKSRGQRLRAWQKRTSSWEKIAAQFAEALQLPTENARQ